MPWDDLCVRDTQALPGLSLVQWMNMQQNTSLANSVQQNYINSLSGSVLQNLGGTDLSRQLNFSTPQIPQASNLQFNAQRLPQQAQHLDQLPKLPSTMLPLGSVMQPQQQLSDITQQARQNIITQTLPSSQVQAQILQPQTLVQGNNILQQQLSSHQLSRNLPQNMQPQQQPQQQQQLQQQQQQQQQNMVALNQQQNLTQPQLSDQVNQHLQMSDSQIQLQLLQKLQQQQQAILAQQSTLQQPAQLPQLQDPQRQLLDASQSYPRSVVPSQMMEIPNAATTSLPQSNVIPNQMTKSNSQTNIRFSQTPQQLKLQQQQSSGFSELPGNVGLCSTVTTNQLSMNGSSMMTGAAGAGQSVITDDVPSCSTSPSTNNCPNVQTLVSNRASKNTTLGEDMAQSSAMLLNPNALETVSSNVNMVKDLPQKSDVKPSLNISKSQSQGFLAPQTYLNGNAPHMDYLDTSSSTSVCLSQNDIHLQTNNNSLTYNPQSMLMRDPNQDGEVQADLRNNIPYGSNVDGQLAVPMNHDSLLTKGIGGLAKDFSNTLSSGGMLANYESSKDAQQELSSSIVSQSFGVPDMTFNSIDSTINDASFLNRSTWAPPPQFQRMRTYTKVCCSR